MSVTRLPSGLSTRKSTDPLGSYTAPDPTDEHRFFDDFNIYGSANWTLTAVGTSTAALAAGDGGILALTTGSTSSDSASIQKTTEGFTFDTGKPAWFKARLKVSALTSVIVAGLQITDTTPEDVTDGVYFLSTATTGALTLYVRRNASTGSASVAAGALVADTYTDIAWYWDGKDTISAYQDGVLKGSVGGVAASFLPDAATTISLAARTTTAAAKTASIDYVFASKSRR